MTPPPETPHHLRPPRDEALPRLSQVVGQDTTRPVGPVSGGGVTSPPETGRGDERLIAVGAGTNLLGSVFRAIRPLFFILVARLFGDVTFGVFTLGLTVLDLAAFLALFGFEDALLKYVAEYRATSSPKLYPVLRTALLLSGGSALLLALIFIVGGQAIGRAFGKPDLGTPLSLMAAGLPFFVMSKTLLAACRGSKVMLYSILTLDIGESLLLVGVTFGLYSVWRSPVALYAAYPIAEAAVLIMATGFYSRLFSVRETIRARGWPRDFLSFSAPVGLSNLLGQFMQKIDVFLCGYFLPLSQVGVYRVANDIAYLLVKIRAAFTPIISPLLSEFHATGRTERLHRCMVLVARWSAALAFPVVAVFFLAGGDLLGLYGPTFRTGKTALVLLGGAFFINLSLGPTPQLTAIGGRPYRMLAYTVATVGLEAALGVWLIPRFGLVGAALAAGVPLTLSKIPFLFDAWSILGRPPYDRKWLLLALLHGAIAVAALFLLRAAPFETHRWIYYPAIAAGLAAYGAFILRPVFREMKARS